MFSIEYVCSAEVGGRQISPASHLSAKLRISKFCYLSGPSANEPFYGFVIYELNLFGVCGFGIFRTQSFCGLKTSIIKYINFLLENVGLECSDSKRCRIVDE
jgi:hypothetical protein